MHFLNWLVDLLCQQLLSFMLIWPFQSTFRDTVLRLWNLFCSDTRQKTKGNVKIRREVLDIFNDILKDFDNQNNGLLVC